MSKFQVSRRKMLKAVKRLKVVNGINASMTLELSKSSAVLSVTSAEGVTAWENVELQEQSEVQEGKCFTGELSTRALIKLFKNGRDFSALVVSEDRDMLLVGGKKIEFLSSLVTQMQRGDRSIQRADYVYTSVSALKRAAASCLQSTSDEELRFENVHLEASGGSYTLSSTDGHRATQVKQACGNEYGTPEFEVVSFSRLALKLIAKMDACNGLGNTIGVYKDCIKFINFGFCFNVERSTLSCPNFQEVIQRAEEQEKALVNASRFKEVFDTLAKAAGSKAVHVSIEGKEGDLHFTMPEHDDEVIWEAEVKGCYSGELGSICIKPLYLKQAIACFKDAKEISFHCPPEVDVEGGDMVLLTDGCSKVLIAQVLLTAGVF